MNKEEKFQRLSSNVKPINYKLKIIPDFSNFTNWGQVFIDVHINESTDFIELHSVDLRLNKVEFQSSTNDVIKSVKIEQANSTETVKIYFLNRIEPGLGQLRIEFDGYLNDNLQGFYKIQSIDRNGISQYGAVTQLEPAYARQVFPCFDEPALKATFDVIVVAHKTKTVLSNMPLKKLVILNDWNNLAEFHFERSPVMSTYLVAFVIGYYDFLERQDENGIKIRVYTPVGKSNLGQYSLDVASKALPFFTKYFDFKYPLPKLDLIGLDCEIEAMENWGLITFKESLLLLDLNDYSIQTKIEVALNMCHEIAHQWFGNVVTMEWWTHLWLNEGFATWIEYLGGEHYLPELNLWSFYAVEHLYKAFELDALETSHPIEVEVGSPNEINQIFDAISYSKGSSIIRMLNNYIGKDFVIGLQNYLKKYQYKNAKTDDLWNELGLASNKSVYELMQAWTKTSGYPLVEVSKSLNSQQETILYLKQTKYSKIAEKSSSNEAITNSIWKIPITIRTKSKHPNNHTYQLLMETQTAEVNLGVLNDTEWILINPDYMGFYRTKYSNEMFEQLLTTLKDPLLLGSNIDRIALVNDAFALTDSNLLSAYDLMRLIWLLKNETDTYVWTIILKQIPSIQKRLLGTNFYSNFNSFLNSLLKNKSIELGLNLTLDNDDLKRFLKEKILYSLARTDDNEFKSFAKKAYQERNITKIPADLQKAVYASVLRDGDERTVDEFFNMYLTSSTPDQKERIILLLSEVVKEKLINKTLELSLLPAITKEESVNLLVSLAENPTSNISAHLTWNFIKKNWSVIYSRYYESILLGRLLKPIIQTFNQVNDLNDIEKFFNENPTPVAENAINQGIEVLKSNIVWSRNQNGEIERFLKDHNF